MQSISNSGPQIADARTSWDGPLPLSFAQERLWFLDQLGFVGAAYNMPMAVRLQGALDTAALERSLAELERRHETLRTRFGAQGGVPYQLIDPPGAFRLQRADLSNVTDAHERDLQLHALLSGEHQHRFELHKGPLWRVLLVRLGDLDQVLMCTIHHSIADGWSLGVLRRELSSLYAAYASGRRPLLPDLPVQYADYAIWQRQSLREAALQDQLAYWKARLADAPPKLGLPTDRPRPLLESFGGARLEFHLPPALGRALRELARYDGATLFMVLLAAYQVLLARWSGQQDIVVGVPIAGRSTPEVEKLIGFFVNTLALRTTVDPGCSFRELLRRVQEDLTLGAYANQELPFELLVKELRPERHLTRQPIFQTALIVQNYPDEPLELPGLSSSPLTVERVNTHFDLALYLHGARGTDGLTATFEYASDLFDVDTIARMAAHMPVLLAAIVAAPERRVGDLALLGKAEQELLSAWNATSVPYGEHVLVHELFEAQVAMTPEALAVMCAGRSLTFAELNVQANRLARVLRSKGVGPDRLVAICAERGPEMVIGLLAILKAGGAYLPLDPNYPRERLQHMLSDAAPTVLLTQQSLEPILPATHAEVLILDATRPAEGTDANLPVAELGLTAAHLVYLIYTSGSTGRPKGTAMAHRSMVNLLHWHGRQLPLRSAARVLQFAALSFDVAFQEIFSTLCGGGTLVLPSEEVRRNPRALLDFLRLQQIERLFLPPLMLQSLAECVAAAGAALPADLEEVITAGEQLRISPEIVTFFQRLDGCRLHNHYGPTETHVVTALTLPADTRAWPALPSIGQPIANVRIHVLDPRRQPVPIGVTGEIYVGGVAVARGYLHRPELTAERFVDDPFSVDPQARLYRTGDLARWRAAGTLEYLGRNDDQVKIRGFRIELEEVTAELLKHERVRDAAVVAREDEPGARRLVAYFTQAGASAPTVKELRTHLQATLPGYMIPDAFVLLGHLPLSPNGKLHRSALPAPDFAAYVESEYEPPHGEVEEAIADIWRDLLRIGRVGRHDNFFHLGGHSLLAARVIAHVSDRLELDLPLRMMFERPTVAGLADFILRDIAAEMSLESP